MSCLCFCDVLGSPPVKTILADAVALSIIPGQCCGTIVVTDQTLMARGDGDLVSSRLQDAVKALDFQFIPGTPAARCLAHNVMQTVIAPTPMEGPHREGGYHAKGPTL